MQASGMAHATEIPLLLYDSGIEISEFPVNVLYGQNKKSSQSLLGSLNIISDLIQRK